MPRSSSHASNGPSTAPRLARSCRMRAHDSSARAVTSAPASTSEWPLSCFVAECMTRSAPSRSGRHSTGVATVPSTTTRAPASRAISAVAAMSVSTQVGFDGVSTQTMRVEPGRRARRRASWSPFGTRSSAKRPVDARCCSQLRMVQYISAGATTWSPGASVSKTVVAAAIPEPKSSASWPSSRRASSASQRSYVGFWSRV